MSNQTRVRLGMFLTIIVVVNWAIVLPRLTEEPDYFQAVWVVLSLGVSLFTFAYFLIGGDTE